MRTAPVSAAPRLAWGTCSSCNSTACASLPAPYLAVAHGEAPAAKRAALPVLLCSVAPASDPRNSLPSHPLFQWRTVKHPLESVRPFQFSSVTLAEQLELDPANQEGVTGGCG